MISTEEVAKKFDARIAAAMTKNNLPGLAVTLVRDGEILFSQGYGSRDIKKFLPYTPDTVNGFGSCTKSFTSIAILKLAEEGKLSIDDPVSDHIPLSLGLESHPILIRHLMSHTSGIPNLGSAELIIGQSFPMDLGFPPIPFVSDNDFFNHVNQADNEIHYKPGEHFHYFNAGYTMLQFIIEKAAGMSYPDYIQEVILQPLGMERSGFVREKFTGESNISIPYVMLPKDGKPTPTPTFFPFNRFIYGPGGLISSTNEMIKYVEMLMNRGRVGEKQIISEHIVDQMIQMHYKGRIHPTLSSFGESGYGFGLGITKDFFGDDVILHGGGITGGVSLIGFLKNSKIGFAAIGNADGFPSEEILSLLAIVIGKNPDVDLQFMKRIKFFEKLQGNYSTYADINKRKIVNKGGVLFLESEVPPSSVPLIPQTDDPEPLDFYIINIFGVKMPVEFRIDQDSIHFTIERNSYHKQS